MRSILVISVLCVFFLSKAQCDPVENFDWIFTNDSTLVLSWENSGEESNYEVELRAIYDDSASPPTPEIQLFEGVSLAGSNTVSIAMQDIDWDEVSPLSWDFNRERYFYELRIRQECSDLTWSPDLRTYCSPFSMLNDPGLANPDFHFSPITYLPDGIGTPYETTIIIPDDSLQTEIDSIQVLIDIGHSYNGDLSISITNPYGVTVDLLSFNNSLGASTGLSLVFQDGAAELGNLPVQAQGIVQPASPLSAFVGFPKSGVWTVSVIDNLGIDAGFLFGVGLFVNSSICEAGISGTAFADFNSDGVRDSSEPGLAGIGIDNSITSTIAISNSDGEYARCSTPGTGTLTPLMSPMYYEAVPAQIDIDLDLDEFAEDLNFAFQPTTSIVDINVEFYAIGPDRPGFENTYFIHYENVGTECLDMAELNVIMDEQLTILSSTEELFSFSGNEGLLAVGELCPFDEAQFSIVVGLPETAVLGDTLTSTVSLEEVGDGTPWNNSESVVSIIVGSYDPNDKQVDLIEIGPDFTAGTEKLEYMIRFQNTGTYLAERVVILDSLPALLDVNTLEVMSSSDDYVFSHVGQVAYFTYDDIFLPDSASDFEGSIGYVRFKIDPIEDLQVGDIISNKAGIYFDFNAPIITNTVETEVVQPSSLLDIDPLQFTAYPNPAESEIIVPLEETISDLDSWRIVDATGRVVKQGRWSSDVQQSLNVDDLATGTYQIELISETQVLGSRAFFKR